MIKRRPQPGYPWYCF